MTQATWVGPRIDGLHNMPVCTNPTCRDSPCGVQSASDSIMDAPWGKVLSKAQANGCGAGSSLYGRSPGRLPGLRCMHDRGHS